MIDSFRADLRLAIRGLWRARGFTVVAILILSLGMAGTTMMFALIEGVLLRPLPLPEQDRLVVAWKDLPTSGLSHHPFGSRDINRIAAASQLFDDVAGVDANGGGSEVIADGGDASYVNSALVTGRFFAVLRVQPVLGRTLREADDIDGAEPVIAISHGLWQRRYGSAPTVIGRRVTLGDTRFTIVGVMPPGLDYPTGVEIWRPTHSVPVSGPFGDAARREIDLVGRLRPAVTVDRAAAELTALTRRLEDEAPAGAPRGFVPVVHRLEDVVVGSVRPALVGLMAAVTLVLFIASANVANLLLLRGEGRRAELAVHEALGAGRFRIMRLLLAEAVVITVAGAIGGLVTAWWSLHGLLALLPDTLPRLDAVRIDGGVAAFVVVAAMLTTAMAGLAPALSVGRADLLTPLRSGGRGVSGSPARHLRRMLVVAQIALAVMVLAAAGVLARSLLHLQSVDTGLAAERLVVVDLAVPPGQLADRARHSQFLAQAVTRLESLSPIAGATPVNAAPFSEEGGWDVPRFTAEGQTADRAAANPALNLESVHPNYFETMGIPLRRGRVFTDADRAGGLTVAIVSEEVAARVWPGDDPIGKRIKLGGTSSTDPWRTIVGVAAGTRYRELATARPTVYLPAAQFLDTAQRLVVRSSVSVDVVASLAREHVQASDPNVRVMSVAPFGRMLDRPLARPRFNAMMLGLFACAALTLSTVGLYAMMAAYVRHREREIAVRTALGATPRRIRRLVLTEALWLAIVGAGLGLGGAVIATRLIAGMIHGVRAMDPASLIGAALMLVAAALLASFVPIRQASRVDPVTLLRN